MGLKGIRFSMLICFLPIIIAALLTVYGFSFRYTEDNVQDNSIKYILQLIEQVNHDIDSYISYMENISMLTAGDGDVLEYLFSENDPDRQWQLNQNILDRFQIVRKARNDICNIGVITRDGKYVINDEGVKTNPYVDIYQEDWYKFALTADPGTTLLSSSHVQNIILDEYPWVVTLSSALRYPGREQNEGVFFIDLNYNAIDELCSHIDLGSRGYVFIIDDKGKILYHPKQQLIYSGLKEDKTAEVLNCGSSYFLTGKGSESKLYVISKSDKTGWTTVGVAYTSELVKNRPQIRLIYTLVMVVLLICLTGLVTLLSKHITKPITLLQNTMKKVEKGNFEKINTDDFPDNEMGSLGRSFNMMSDQIQKLMEDNVKEQELKRKSELRVLQSQINPHFLYNTLDSIVWMAEGGKNKEVVRMTLALSRLFRQTISSDKQFISIGQEVDYVRNYLEIQQMRYKDKLTYELDIEEAIKDKPIIKLVLQPLVENALYHGIKYREAGGLIRILGRKAGKEIHILVIDNGPGMTREQLDTIFEKHKVSYQHNGVGVYNVQTRLQLYYGREYGISYESVEGKGTTALIRIPDSEGGVKDEEQDDR